MAEMSETPSALTQYPLLPLRDVVVFPHMVIPLFVGRPKSIKAMETAMEAGKSILLVAQKSAAKDDPGPEDMYEIGCVSGILQMLKLPDGTGLTAGMLEPVNGCSCLTGYLIARETFQGWKLWRLIRKTPITFTCSVVSIILTSGKQRY
jgi:hypothetical protein